MHAEEENVIFQENRCRDQQDIHNILRQLNNVAYQQVNDYCANVPLPPAASRFSTKQLEQQQEFFREFLTLSMHEASYTPTDVYKFKIIAVRKFQTCFIFFVFSSVTSSYTIHLVPESGNAIQRTIIETLFAVHGRATLNMICMVKHDPNLYYGRPYELDWCKYLKRPPAWHRQIPTNE